MSFMFQCIKLTSYLTPVYIASHYDLPWQGRALLFVCVVSSYVTGMRDNK